MQTLRGLGMVRLVLLGGVSLGLVLFFVFMLNRLMAPSMALLYGNLEVSDASDIVSRLESMGVPYELRGNGTQVLVPSDRVLNLRMNLAGEGLPGGGSVGYELFDKSDSFGTTNLVQNINMVRALEGELARTISSMAPIAAARVHLVLPQRELFSRQQAEASASIALKLRSAGGLTHGQVAAIQNLVAAAVPGLKPTHIAIVDDDGNLLARGTGEEDDETASSASNAEDYRVSYESRIKRTVEELLERSVGPGNVRAEVHADIDFDRLTTNDEIYDPDGQVVRSQQTVEEHADNTDKEASQAVSASSNLPDAQSSDEGSGASNVNRSSRTEETINYEISRTTRTHVRERGTIKRLSVAVLVDGRYQENDAGEKVYQPRSSEELAQLAQLVQSAVGYDESRGDKVEVINMQFAKVKTDFEAQDDSLGLGNLDVMKILEIVVLGFVAVLVVLLVLRPLVSRLLSAQSGLAGPIPAGDAGMAALTHTEPQPALAAPQQAVAPAPQAATPSAPPPPIEDEEPLIDMARVEGRVKQSYVRKIGEIVDKHPEEALNIVRNWLYSD